ncbi:hypothetical protein M3Y97_00401200 [Aphelenchoides bicaudatus]|nr:hypothetical protein M3Y97_00401200 [Aphelenchoides bicaudatus]
MSTPYLGSKISLISRLDIRYEGILYTVDANEATIALAKVRSFGTENRPTDHPVKARDEIYEYIIFKASDIKDLVVCEGPKESEPSDDLDDPAIVSISKPPAPVESQALAPKAAPKTYSPVSQSKPQAPVGKPAQQQSGSNQPPPYHRKQPWQGDNRPQQQQPQRQGNPNNRVYHQQQHPGYNNQRQNNNRPFNRTTAPKEKLKAFNLLTDYDFEKANEQFKEKIDDVADELAEKIDLNVENEESNSVDENEKESGDECYDKKSSFFDSISCEALEKAEGRTNRPDWRKERQTNYETFGQNSVRSHAYQNYHRRFNNQGYRPGGNRPPQGGEQQQRYGPRQNNNGPGNFQGNRRFNNRDQQQGRDNQRPNQQHAYY